MERTTTMPSTEVRGTGNGLVRRDTGADRLNMTDAGAMQSIRALSQDLASSDLIPDHYKDKPGNCFVACLLAHRIGLDPLTVMQESFIIKGKPGFSARFKIAMAERSGVFTGPITYEDEGDTANPETLGCTAHATLARTGQEVTARVTYKEAKAEGWTDRTGNKYRTMPGRQLRWRAGSYLCDLFAAGTILGLATEDDIYNAPPQEPREVEAAASNPVATINASLAAEPERGDPDPHDERPAARAVFDRLEEAILGCATLKALETVQKDMKSLNDEGTFTADEKATLRMRFNARKAELTPAKEA